MPIGIACSCGKSLRVPDEYVGRRVKCPACSAIVSVPSPPATVAPVVVFKTPVAAPETVVPALIVTGYLS